MDKLTPEAARLYPVTYRAPFVRRCTPALIYTPLLVLTLAGIGLRGPTMPGWFWLIIGLAIFHFLFSILNTSFCKVTLYADRIEKKSWVGGKVMKRCEAGRIRKRGFGLVMLAYKYNSGDGMVLPNGIGGDAAWETWMIDAPAATMGKR